ADDQQRLREVNTELASRSVEFEQTLSAGRNAAAVHVTDEAQLAGLSPEERATLRQAAVDQGLEGWLIPIINTSGQPLLEVLEDCDRRYPVNQASTYRGWSGQHATRDIAARLARLRHERARLLGYPHHAAHAQETSCAKRTEAVNHLLRTVAPSAVGLAERE